MFTLSVFLLLFGALMVLAGVTMGFFELLSGPYRRSPATDCVLKGASTLIVLGMASLIFFLFMPATARAEERRARVLSLCGPWDAMKEKLASRYGEVPIGGGVVDGSTMLQVLASPDGSTWTLVTIDTAGMACLKGTGTGWEQGVLPARERKT